MGAGFPFETDSAVGGAGVEDQAEAPFQEVEQVESEEPQFPHLGGVDPLMPEKHFPLKRIQLPPDIFPDENDAEQVDAQEPREREELVLNDSHASQKIPPRLR